MVFEGKRSGQIPAFGDWDNANELPITQYFESARQAGLVRYSSALSDNQCHPYMTGVRGSGGGYPIDFYAAGPRKPSGRVVAVPPIRRGGEADNGEINRRRCGHPPHLKQQQQQQRIKQVQVKVYDVVDVKRQQLPRPRTRSQQLFYNNNNNQKQKQQQQHFPKHSAIIADQHYSPILTQNRPTSSASANHVKPVDEDLYKIPPELLLHNSKRKKMLGFFSKCFVPPCKA